MNEHKYMIKKNSPHIIAFNPNFEHDPDFIVLPNEFDIIGYQNHMRITKAKPTKTFRAFIKNPSVVPDKLDEFTVKEKPKQKFADGLKEELNIVKEETTIENMTVIPEVKMISTVPKDLSTMNKSQIIEIGKELGINLEEDMLKRNMISSVREFIDSKKKIEHMKKMNEDRFPGV